MGVFIPWKLGNATNPALKKKRVSCGTLNSTSLGFVALGTQSLLLKHHFSRKEIREFWRNGWFGV